MTAALIHLNAAPGPLESIKQGNSVALSNADDTGVSTWEWTLISKPAGSVAVLASTSAPTTSFTADVEGAYLVRLIVNKALGDRADARAIARIKTPHLALRLLARDETTETDVVEGWASTLREAFQFLEKGVGLATKKTAVYSGSLVSAPVALFITGSYTLLNGDVVPLVSTQTTEGTGKVFFGIYDDQLVSIGGGDVVKVVTGGHTSLFTNPGGFVAGDLVYAVASGAIGKTAGSAASHLIGVCCEVSGGDVRVNVFPSVVRINSTGSPVAVSIDAAGTLGSDDSFARSGHGHGLTTYASAPPSCSKAAATAGTSGTAPARGNHTHQIVGPIEVANAPTIATEVANKLYVDNKHTQSNCIINGRFDFKHRLTTADIYKFIVPGTNVRTLISDRWSGWSAGGEAWFVPKPTGGTLLGSVDGYLDVFRKSGETGNGELAISQEIDRNFVYSNLRSKQGKIRFRALKYSGFTGASSTLSILLRTGTGATPTATGKSGYTGSVDVVTSAVTLTTSWQWFEVPVTSTIGSAVTTAELRFYFTTVGTAPANDGFAISDVMLYPGDQGTAYEASPNFVYAGGSYDADLRLCRKYYETSYSLNVPQASVVPGNALAVVYDGHTFADQDPIPDVGFVPFVVAKPWAPALYFWTLAGVYAQWTVGSTDFNIDYDVLTERGFTVLNNDGAPVVAAARDLIVGHWAADCDF